ncbi:MAG: DUF559 domain-containing protein [Candidatus Nezhaarchaeales archaeon]
MKGLKKRETRSPPLKAYTSGELTVIKELQLRGIKFFTQIEISFQGRKFILDIFVPPNLVIEVDGPHHLRGIRSARDEIKDEVLRNMGLKVLRFQDSTARSQPSKVVDEILKALEK